MRSLVGSMRSLGAFLLTSIASLAAFGLVLGFLQTVASSEAPALQLGLTILSAALAFALGGFALARLNPATWLRHALSFGLLFGGFGFVYIMGPGWAAVFAALLAGLAAGFGGWLAVSRM